MLMTRKSRKLIGRLILLMWVFAAISSLAVACAASEAPPTSLPEEAQPQKVKASVLTGADQMDKVVAACTGKQVALVANPTSQVAGVHLLDTLIAVGVDVVRVFGPEHGFRGDAADGEKVDHSKDEKTGMPIVSLYGNNRKPTPEQMVGIDLVIFDVQDVGARFYTYISTLHLMMEAAAESGVTVLVLDRPNPHAHYVDGPVLKPEFSSFVGMHPVPVVHGMTVAEYAQMINGEGLLSGNKTCALQVIPCVHYARKTHYELPVAPSPNLPNMQSIMLYPSLAFFEGTNVSVGRGTDKPFQQIGMPGFASGEHRFTPRSIPGVSKYPPHEGKECVGFDLSSTAPEKPNQLDLKWLLTMYENAPDQSQFFLKSGFFNKLSGTDQLMKQIQEGLSEEEIRTSWQLDLDAFREVRKRYLIYEE